MLTQLLLFFLLLFFLRLLSGRLSQRIYSLFCKIFRSQKIAIGLLSFLLLPGTIIHEMSHFLVAVLLFVPTGKMSVFPSLEKGERGKNEIYVKAGQLELGHTDPIRRTIIGLAPIISGLSIIYFIGNFLSWSASQLTTYNLQLTTIILLFVSCYLLFVISLTMFSSPKDLEPLKIVAPLSFIFLLVLHLIRIKIILPSLFENMLHRFLSRLNPWLLFIAIIGYSLLFFLELVLSVGRKKEGKG